MILQSQSAVFRTLLTSSGRFTHPFLRRPLKPFNAAEAELNPKCWATSLLTKTWVKAVTNKQVVCSSMSQTYQQACKKSALRFPVNLNALLI